ncbi:hypothetical protein Scep_028475 [Stephania cephalantha]|uniref:Uncharacterized protein n=1 Tax=Stephania cephalantha TaxID=152367 RepID=A0AAP0EHC4_9MAGN
MGCCVSSDIAKTNNNDNNTSEAPCPSNLQNLQDRALVPEPETTPTTHYIKSTKPPKSLSPPLTQEEETVKEVLSETPTVVPKPNPPPPPPPPQQQQQQQQKLLKLPTFPKIQEEKKPLQEKAKNAPHEISEELVLNEEEDSEMYSFVSHESVSTSAITSTTTTDQNQRFIIRDYEDDGSSEVVTGYKKAPNKVQKRPSVPNRSPARRSPAKRAGGDPGQPSIGLREMGPSPTAARRRILAGNGGGVGTPARVRGGGPGLR